MNSTRLNDIRPSWVLHLCVAACAILGFASCTPGPGRRGELSASFVSLPFVRVLLSDTAPLANISGSGPIAIECLKDGKRFVFYASKRARVKNDDGELALLDGRGKILEEDVEQVTIMPRAHDQTLWVGDTKYRGMVRVLANGASLFVINILHIEDYLFGVVPPELGPITESDIEAIKAQAIAARTYTMAHLGQFPNKPYDLKSDVSDQLYQGMGAEKRFVSDACVETRGLVARYGDKFIDGYYHSTCGGFTDCIENVWPKDPRPYLVGVSCSSMCAPSKYTSWQETFTGEALASRISSFESATTGKETSIDKVNELYIDNSEPLCPSMGLRTQRLVIMADGHKVIYERDRIRWLLGRGADPNRILQSDYFSIGDLSRNDDGAIRTVTLVGRGYGHGVGMCQMGALGMARQAKLGGTVYSYKDILQRYYRGISIDRMY